MSDSPDANWDESTQGSTPYQRQLDHQFRLITFDKEHQMRVLKYFVIVLAGMVISEFVF